MQPVFVIGCVRSGTTMLGAMLGGHSNVVCLQESQFLVDLLPNTTDGPHIDPVDVIDRMVSDWRFHLTEFDLGTKRPPRCNVRHGFREAFEWYVREYAATIGRKDASVWIEHESGHVSAVARLSAIFPNAKFVHLVRDGRGVAASLMPLIWGPNRIIRAARSWQDAIAYGLGSKEYLKPKRYCLVRYEDILFDTESTMRRLADFLEIGFEPSMLSPAHFTLPIHTRKDHQLITKPPLKENADKWKRQLTKREIEIFEHLTGDLLVYLGYERLTRNAMVLSQQEKIRIMILDYLKAIPNGIRFAKRNARYKRTRGVVDDRLG